MKKLLVVAAAALLTTSAFANKMMVKLDGCLDDGRCDTVDFNMQGDDQDAAMKSQTLALNLAYAVTPEFGVGLTYISKSKTSDGDITDAEANDDTTTISFYYNLHGGWDDSCFVALHLATVTTPDLDADGDESGDKDSATVLEYGHRFKIANAWGLNLNYVPSVSYTMNKHAENADGSDDINSTELGFNVANFAVTF